MAGSLQLEIRNLRKEYPGVVALNDLSLSFKPGEVHAIVGENGAGKSTLIKCITGAISPTSGELIINGTSYEAMDPQLSKRLGIGVIYQEFNNVPTMSAAENVFLCEKTGASRYIANTKEREKLASALFRQLGVDIDPSEKVRELSPAYQQIIEIARAVNQNVSFLIMDEPTAPLTVSEVELLFRIIKDLKAKGITIIYISHRLEEIFEIADRVSVLRDGNYVTTRNVAETGRQELIALMVGREMTETCPPRNVKRGREILTVENLTGNGDVDISFALHEGEILGVGGLVGSGRTELMQMLYGVVPHTAGKIRINGQETDIRRPDRAIRNGIALIPEDRKGQGLFLKHSVSWNVSINAIRSICKSGVVDRRAEQALAQKYVDRFRIKTPSVEQKVLNLSGGNQQKVTIAKAMATAPMIAIFDEPTRGIDVNAKQEIYQLMNELVEAGHGVILVSSDMPELIGMSDRIIVISEGHLAGTLDREEFSQERILDLASTEY